MNCDTCKYADWKRTKAGRLHPSGDGLCRYPVKVPTLPKPMYWFNGINRHKPGRTEGCQRWEKAND